MKREYESSAEEDEGTELLSINGRIKSNLAKLCLKDKDMQANALKILSKQAADRECCVQASSVFRLFSDPHFPFLLYS